MNLLLIPYIALLSFLSYRKTSWAVLLIIFILPSYLIRFSILGIPTTLLEISIITVFLIWVIKNYKSILRRKNSDIKISYPFGWEAILILIISLVAVFVGGLSNPALGIFKAYFLEPIILFILILNNLRGPKAVKKIIIALALSTLLVSVLAVWQKITGQFIFNEFWANPENRRVVSFFGYPNAVALYLGPIIPLLVGLFIWQSKGRGGLKVFMEQLFLFAVIILNFLAIYFSKSKGAIIAIIFSLLVSALILLKRKISIIVLVTLIIGAGSFYYFKKDWVDLKLSSSFSYQVRIKQWGETRNMLKEGRLLWGAGLANYQETIKPYHQEGIFFNKDADPDFSRKIVIFDDKYRAERWQPLEIYLYPHNIFLNFWVELGFLGMIIFSWLIFKFLFLSLRYYYKNKNGRNAFLHLSLFSSMLIILIHGIFDVPYFKNDLSALFWVIIALFSMLKIQSLINKK